MGDRIAVMNEGVLEQVGTPEELYERPANRFVAGFIGSPAMSFFEASASDGRLRAPEIDLAVNGAALPSSVVVGVRPEHARPWREGLVGPLRGRVAFVEALGRETFIGVDVGSSRLVVFEEGRATRDVGETIEFGLVPCRAALLRRIVGSGYLRRVRVGPPSAPPGAALAGSRSSAPGRSRRGPPRSLVGSTAPGCRRRLRAARTALVLGAPPCDVAIWCPFDPASRGQMPLRVLALARPSTKDRCLTGVRDVDCRRLEGLAHDAWALVAGHARPSALVGAAANAGSAWLMGVRPLLIVRRWRKQGERTNDAGDRMGRIDLHYAAGEGDVNRLRELLRGGADQNGEGLTPLHFAAIHAQPDAAKVLLDARRASGPGGLVRQSPALQGRHELPRGCEMIRLLSTREPIPTTPTTAATRRSVRRT